MIIVYKYKHFNHTLKIKIRLNNKMWACFIQAINWIVELCDVMSEGNLSTVPNTPQAELLQEEHAKIETTAKVKT